MSNGRLAKLRLCSAKFGTSRGCYQKGFNLRDLEVAVDQLSRPDKDTYALLLRQCGNAKALKEGKRVHAHMVKNRLKRNAFLGNHLVQMYGSCGDVDSARSVFNGLHLRNVFSWNIMVAAYAQNGHSRRAVEIYRAMLQEGAKPDNVTFVNVLAAAGTLTEGKEIQAHVVRSGFCSDIVVATSLVSMYGRFGNLDGARAMFDTMLQRNVVSWTAMITAYTQNGLGKEALDLYQRMEREGLEPDAVTFISVLDACISAGALTDGKAIHGCIIARGLDSDVSVMNALVNMYAKCGSLALARSVFDKTLVAKNSVSWTAMIAAYAQHGHIPEVLELLQLMALDGMKSDEITFINVLFACSHVGTLDQGWECFVSMVEDHGLIPMLDHYVCMLDLLGRVGQLEQAEELVRSMPFQPDHVVWMTLLAACDTHGDYERGLRVAKQRILIIYSSCLCSLEGMPGQEQPRNLHLENALDKLESQ